MCNQLNFVNVILILSFPILSYTQINTNAANKYPSDKNTNVNISDNSKSNILFVIIMATHSHRTAVEPLAHKLVEIGHNVTFLTPIKPSKPNPKFHEFSTKSVDKFYNEVLSQLGDQEFPSRLENKYANIMPNPIMVSQFLAAGTELYFNSPEFLPWVESANFDLVIVDNGANQIGYALAHKFKSPVVLFNPTGFWSYDEERFGIPAESSSIPNYFLTNVFTENLTFYDKIYSTLYPFYMKAVFEWWTIPKIDELARRILGLPEMPSITELERETRLVFTNQHFSHDYARSLPPLIVQVGGMHCEESKKSLPKEMEEFIAGAKDDGFIYISFGSIINMSKVPDHLVNVLFDAIKTFKTRFLWKWDGEAPAHLPSNVFVAKWFPQQDVIAHSKIKGFITHGGQMSTQQGVFFGVPMIVIPVLYDQPYNAKTVVNQRIGIHLELSELTAAIFTEAISQIITDPIYAQNAKRVSELFRDRPLSAVNTAVYWTEYVLRNKNSSHLKPLAMNQSWWERRLLDVWLFLLIVFISVLYGLFKVFKLLLYSCFEFGKRAEANPELKHKKH